MKLVKDNENESNSQLALAKGAAAESCVKLVKDNENESNSQLLKYDTAWHKGCVKLVKDNENESNSQLNILSYRKDKLLCEAGQR